MLRKAWIALILSSWFATVVRGEEKDVQKEFLRSHSLFAPYIDSNLEMSDWNYGGQTGVSTYKYVRLTPNSPSKHGWIYSKEKLMAQHWQVEFQFRVGESERELDGDMDENASKSQRKVFGDGFAFWLTENQFNPGSAFGNDENFKGLGVFFDTFRNSASTKGSFPLISVLVNPDGSKHYDHDQDGGSDLPYCSVKFRNEKLVRARITYLEGKLTVETTVGSAEDWKECIKLDRVFLPKQGGKYYMGFSAATGQVHDEHEIVYVMTNKLESTNTRNGGTGGGNSYNYANDGGSAESSSSVIGWSWLLVILVCVLGFGAYYYNRALSGNPISFANIASSFNQKNKNF